MAYTLIGTLLGISVTVGAINMSATLKLIERVNIGPFSGMILNANSGSCVTIINGLGNQIETACAKQGEQRPNAQFLKEIAKEIVQNGGFEDGLTGWGTGFYERMFRQNVGALQFGGASSNWTPDSFALKGRRALRVQHESAYAPNVFSSLSQQVTLDQSHRYEARFWAYIKDSGDGFSLRVIPSRNSTPEEWERYKVKPKSGVRARWQEVTTVFESGAERSWDLRFTAEAPATLWIDEVSVRDLGAVTAPR
jgi:hypothetical protein